MTDSTRAALRGAAAVTEAVKAAYGLRISAPDRELYYISGPMRGYKDFNYPLFHRVADELRKLGHGVLSPAELGEVEGWHWEDYMRRDLAVIPLCTAICMLPGWEGSKGATQERAVAMTCGLRVVYYDASTGLFATTPPSPELGRLDVTFTVVTRDAEGRLMEDLEAATEAARETVELARRHYRREYLRGPGEHYHLAGVPLTVPEIQIEGPVIHSSQATLDQGLDTTVPGLREVDSHG